MSGWRPRGRTCGGESGGSAAPAWSTFAATWVPSRTIQEALRTQGAAGSSLAQLADVGSGPARR